MKNMIAILTMAEDLESPVELRIYRSNQDIAEGNALEIFPLTNAQLAELTIVQRIKVVRTNNDGVPLGD